MAKLSDDQKRLLERCTLLVGAIEMLMSAAMSVFPDIFPSWLQVLCLAIGVLTFGVAITLLWTDIGRVAAALRLRPSWIGPIIAAAGLAIILGLGFSYWYQAPKGTFAGSSAGIVLVAAILVVSFFFLTAGNRAAVSRASPALPDWLPGVPDRLDSISNTLEAFARQVTSANTAHDNALSALRSDIAELSNRVGAIEALLRPLDKGLLGTTVGPKRAHSRFDELEERLDNLAGLTDARFELVEAKTGIDEAKKESADALRKLHAYQTLNEVLRIRPRIKRLATLLERAAKKPEKENWSLWHKRYEAFLRAVNRYGQLIQPYLPNQEVDVRETLFSVPGYIYRNTDDLDPGKFPRPEMLHDLKTFRYTYQKYDELVEDITGTIRKKSEFTPPKDAAP